MKKEIENLKLLFKEIKKNEYNKNLRKGTTGIGYTFESLINKTENNLYLPDYNGIEIKTKLGYSKSPLTLFSLTPNKENDRSTRYLLENYGYPSINSNYKSFKTDAYVNKNNFVGNNYIIKLKIDNEQNKLKLLILNINLEVLDESIYWDLNEIKKRLETKLTYLAYIIGYPYNKNNNLYYKYTNLKIYKLKDFNEFLKLLENNKIHITFNIDYFRTGKRAGDIHDRGTAFRLDCNHLLDLFNLIDKI